MVNPNFRHEARQALERARAQLATRETQCLKYAALELRMAMEALTYDRAQAFAAELPPNSYDTWQPRKLLMLLLEIDPLADKDSTLSLGVEEEYGVRPARMDVLGSEKVLSLKTLKRHYDALGSYLHVPTIKQLNSDTGAADTEKLAGRCNEVADFIAGVLSSPVFNITLGMFAETPCAECGAMIRKRMPPGTHSVNVACFECQASYTLEGAGEGKVIWKPQQRQLQCQLQGCAAPVVIWEREIEAGRSWTCSRCSSKNLICLAVALERDSSGDSGQRNRALGNAKNS